MQIMGRPLDSGPGLGWSPFLVLRKQVPKVYRQPRKLEAKVRRINEKDEIPAWEAAVRICP